MERQHSSSREYLLKAMERELNQKKQLEEALEKAQVASLGSDVQLVDVEKNGNKYIKPKGHNYINLHLKIIIHINISFVKYIINIC